MARQEYLAIGIRVALHPMADLATEPRWARASGCFGEDAELASRLLAAYIRRFPGDQLGPHSVACMTKHFPGGGPQADGEDPHFATGKDQVYPGDKFEYHLRPFEAGVAAGTAQIMPYYGRPIETELEEVGFGFNRDVITGMLRGRYGFDGVVCTDWASSATDDARRLDLARRRLGGGGADAADRVAKIVEAGCDQLGGEIAAGALRRARRGPAESREERIDESVRRILRDKFRLGLFDDPYVDPTGRAHRRAATSSGLPGSTRSAGRSCCSRTTACFRSRAGTKVYVDGLPAAAAAAYGEVVAAPADADVAIVFRPAPFEPRRDTFIESVFHAGRLEYTADERERVLERPAPFRPSSSCISTVRPSSPRSPARAAPWSERSARAPRRSSTSCSAGSRPEASCRSSCRRPRTRRTSSSRTCRATRSRRSTGSGTA